MTNSTMPVCLSLVAFFASGPYLMLVMALMWGVVLSILLNPSFNSIPRTYGWVRSIHRAPGLFLLRSSFLFIGVTFVLFLIGFWW